MPIHAIAGHLVIIIAPLTALLALLYAASSRSRAGLRWPLLVASVATAGLVVWAGEAGGALLDRITANGPAAEVTAAAAHAKGSDSLSVAVFVLLTSVLICVSRLLRPGRTGTAAPRVGAALLALSAVAVLATTWTTLLSALAAVWSNHPSWVGRP